MKFDRKVYFDKVRDSLFYGSLEQDQVDGQEAILTVWETFRQNYDLRWLAYMLATTIHETASTMMPIEEYGKGSGMEYGSPDPETGQTYYGRGFIQLTWRDNYRRGDQELMEKFKIDAGMEAKASNALIPKNAAAVMFLGMEEGWFRGDDEGRQTLIRYFNEDTDDPVNARDIINGDISKNGPMVAGYHDKFLDALKSAAKETAPPTPPTPDLPAGVADVAITVSEGVSLTIAVNGKALSWQS